MSRIDANFGAPSAKNYATVGAPLAWRGDQIPCVTRTRVTRLVAALTQLTRWFASLRSHVAPVFQVLAATTLEEVRPFL
jgi:hypothetical protein